MLVLAEVCKSLRRPSSSDKLLPRRLHQQPATYQRSYLAKPLHVRVNVRTSVHVSVGEASSNHIELGAAFLRPSGATRAQWLAET